MKKARKTAKKTAAKKVKKVVKKSLKKVARDLKPGGVTEYISRSPADVQNKLKEMRAAIRSVFPGAIETMSYFEMPGYSCPGENYDYNGMYAWFSYKKPFIRLHVRPQALIKHRAELKGLKHTVAVVSFPEKEAIPKPLVKKLVKASLQAMKDMVK